MNMCSPWMNSTVRIKWLHHTPRFIFLKRSRIAELGHQPSNNQQSNSLRPARVSLSKSQAQLSSFSNSGKLLLKNAPKRPKGPPFRFILINQFISLCICVRACVYVCSCTHICVCVCVCERDSVYAREREHEHDNDIERKRMRKKKSAHACVKIHV